MSRQKVTTSIEIPLHIEQQEVWDLEEELKLVESVEVDLHEPKDIASITSLVLHITINVAENVAIIAGGVQAVHTVAKILYDFLHQSSKKQAEEIKRKIIVSKHGKRVEIYNSSMEEIERILKEI